MKTLIAALMASSYFVAPQRIGEILYEKAEARRQRYANRRDSLGGTSSYRLGTSGSMMTNIFPARRPRGERSTKVVAQSGEVPSQSLVRPLSAVQSKQLQNTAPAFSSDKHTARSFLRSARALDHQAIDLTVRGTRAPRITDHSKLMTSSLKRSAPKEPLDCAGPEVSAAAPIMTVPTEPLVMQEPSFQESPDRRDSLALSPSLIPYSPAPAADLPISPRQMDHQETVVPQRKKTRILPLKTGTDDTSEKECSGSTAEVSFVDPNDNGHSSPDEASTRALIHKDQDISHPNPFLVPANSRDYASMKDRYMRSLYSTNLQQQKLPKSRYTQGRSHIASQQKTQFSSKSFLANGAQNSREMQLDIEAYRQFCKQLVILAAEQQKLKQGLASKVDDRENYPDLNLTHEDAQRLKSMGYDIPTFCKKLLTMSTKELSNIEAEFERELSNLRNNGNLLGERQFNRERIQSDLKQLNKDVEIPRMRPNSANSISLSMSDVKGLIYERQTNSLLKYSPYEPSRTQPNPKVTKRKTPKVTGIRFDPALIQQAEKKQEEYNKIQSDLYLNKLYIKSLIDEQLTELGNIERIDESRRLVQSKPLMSIRSMPTLKRLPDSMVLSTASVIPVEKQSNVPSRIVTTIPQVTNSKTDRELPDDAVYLKEVTPSISSESSNEYCELRKTFRSAGDHYLMTSSGHYDVDAPIKETGKPYRYKPIVVTQEEVEACIREQEIAKQCSAEKDTARKKEGPCLHLTKPVTRRDVLDGNLEILYRHSGTDPMLSDQKQADFIRNKAPVNYRDVANYFEILSKAGPTSKPIKCALCGKIEYSVSDNADEDPHCMSCRQVLALGRRS
ncbi:hypothetical protein QR46_4384 [Giardia duodenalis assemblage B]|uniref:Uncharacterized protein n=1 Tax=Giardia duodenalis assemblage B TaxID=1394984 RepID=A0A132NNI5_GIAIN|nr:hypothetical protein QR46_4384 [Giardia intestinalis assemblage B]